MFQLSLFHRTSWYLWVLLTKVTRCRSRRFDCLLQVFFRRWGRLVPAQPYVSWWPAAIGAFRSGYCFRVPWFPQAFSDCRASLALMFSNCRHLRFRYFGSVVPVYVVWVKSYVNCLFRFPCVPMVVSVYKLYFVSQRLVSGSVSMFWNRGILSACESYIPVVFFHAFLHGSSRFSGVDFTACAWYLVDYAILLVWVSGIFWSDQPRS